MDSYERRRWIKEAETQGRVADSIDVRMALMAKVKSGEITLEEAQKQLASLKRNAKKNGLITRNQAFHGR